MKGILIFLFLLAPGLVYGKPIYLTCLLTGNPRVYEIKLDEDNGIITHTNIDEGKRLLTFNTKGFFSVNEVSYQRTINPTSPLSVTQVYTINRTTLDISTLWIFKNGSSDNPIVHGAHRKCVIEEKGKNRKF